MDFQKLVQQLHDLMVNAKALVDDYTRRLQQLREESDEFAAKQKTLSDATAAFAAREAEVLKIEDSIKLHKDATDLMQTAQDENRKLLEEKKEFESFRKLETEKLNDLRVQQQREAENNDKRRKEMDNEVNSRVTDFLVTNGFKKA